MSPSFAQAQQAWKQAIASLRYTLNRADFDAWVRDARALQYDGQVLTVGVANAYARDWLTDRLRTTLENALRGILNAPVQVVFVVAPPDAGDDSAPNGTIVPQAADKPQPQEASAHTVHEESTPAVAPPTADAAEAAPSPALDMRAVSVRLRDALQQSHRVIFVPGYFLRWLPLIGTRAGWLYVALRQTFFLANLQPHGPGQRIPPGQALEVSRATLAHWSHLTPRTINNILNQNLLQPLVHVERDRHVDAHRQAPNRYIFTQDMPLTPQDVAAVMAYLLRHGLKEDPLAALAHALQQPPHVLTAPPANADERLPLAAVSDPAPPSLRAHIARHVRGQHFPQDTLAKALGMAELLETSLVEAEGKLFIPWYFIEHHLPRLGHTLAWLYIVARHRAEKEGHPAAHGFRTMEVTSRDVAGWLGLKKARYGRDLIPPLPLDAAASPDDTAAFVRRLPGRGSKFTLAVQHILPLTSADAAAYDIALQALAACVQHDDFSRLHALLSLEDTTEAAQRLRTLANVEEAPADALARALNILQQISPTLPKISSGTAKQPAKKRQIFPSVKPKVSRGRATDFPRQSQNLPAEPAKNFPHVNLLNPKEQTLKNLEEPPDQAGGEGHTWQWHMLPPNLLAPTVQESLQALPAWQWVSWLLYAVAAGEAIEQPVGFAVHKAKQGKSAGGAYDVLAQARPEQLRGWIARHLAYGAETVQAEEPLWLVFSHVPRAKMLQLAAWLGVVDFV